MLVVRETTERTALEQAADPVRRARPDADGNEAGSGMGSGDGEAGRGASTDDETDWLRSAPDGGG
jgi:hypothetical protein